jgi:branched-subunit amino acid transport protein AzlD
MSLYILVNFLPFVVNCLFLLQTLSFLMYLLKSNADYIQSYEESICKSIVNLLVTCPHDSVSIRKARIGLELCKIHVIICILL